MLHVYKFCKLIFRGRPSHNIHRIVSGVQNKGRWESLPRTYQQSVHGRVEMDSHADTTVLGLNCMVLAYTGKECEVSPYADEYDAIRNVPIVTGATVWTNPQDGVPILLVFNEALWLGDRLHHTLINPHQLRSYGVDVPTVWTNPQDGVPILLVFNEALWLGDRLHHTLINPHQLSRCARQPICKRGFGYHNGRLHHSIGHTRHHNFL